MAKIALVVFSTNRLEFLIPSLESQYLINFEEHELTKILIDDFPKDRNDKSMYNLLSYFKYDEVILNTNNKGLSVVWSEIWNRLKDSNYDYIFFQEDDIVYKTPINISSLIPLLEDNTISQLRLERQAWYPGEEESIGTEKYKSFSLIRNDTIFSPMASLYKKEIVDIPYSDFADINLNEGFVGQVLASHYNKYTCKVLSKDNTPLIEHIGEWNRGKIVLKTEPSYTHLYQNRDTSQKRSSRTGESL